MRTTRGKVGAIDASENVAVLPLESLDSQCIYCHEESIKGSVRKMSSLS